MDSFDIETQSSYNYSDNNPIMGKSELGLNNGRIKLQFLRKVYSIIAFKICLTAFFVALSVYNFSFAYFLNTHNYLMIVAILCVLVSWIIIFAFEKQARKTPNNYILLLFFCLGFSYMVSNMCEGIVWRNEYDGETDTYSYVASEEGKNAVFSASIFTVGLTLGLTAYACLTKRDFTLGGGMLFCGIWGLILLGVVAGFSGIAFLYNFYCWLGVMLYCFYLIFDTQLLCNEGNFGLSIDDYAVAVMLIYSDIMLIFIRLLAIMAVSSK